MILKKLICRVQLACAIWLLTLASSPAHSQGTTGSVRIPVTVNVPGNGFLSLALYDNTGTLVRSLLYAKPVQSGQQSVDWDGTTDMGKAAAAGSYTAKGVFFTKSPELKDGMIVGKSGNPPWRTPDGKGDWGGNLGFPSSIVSNGQSVILTSACVEENQITGIQQMNGDGDISLHYFSFYPWDTRMAAAMDSTNYYLGILNGNKKQIEIAEYTVGNLRGRILVELPTGAHEDQSETVWKGRWSNWLDGMAINSDTIFATVKADNALFIIDRDTGQIRQQISIPSPRGIAVSNGKLIVVSNKKVLRLNLNGTADTTLVNDGTLQDPSPIAIDASGNIYVGDGGSGLGPYGLTGTAGTHQIHVFTSSGAPLRLIGKSGGAPFSGHFDETALGVITSIAIGPGADGQPCLWVNDVATHFPRTSRWSLNGQLQRQWFMHKLALHADIVNPARPGELVSTAGAFADEPGITAFNFNFQNKTWAPAWHYENTYTEMYQEDVFLSHHHDGNPLTGPLGANVRWPVFHWDSRNFVTHGNHNYFMVPGTNDNGAIFTYGPDNKPKPIALVTYHRSQKLPDGRIEGNYQGGPNNWFTWADANGDGHMAHNEIIYSENPAIMEKTPVIAEARLEPNLDIKIKRFIDNNGQWTQVDSILPLKEILPNGAPVYDYAQLYDTPLLQTPDLTGGDGTKTINLYSLPIPIEKGDSQYSLVDASSAQPLVLPGIDGYGWWASRNWRKKIARWDKTTGKLKWAVGRRAPGLAENGQMYHPVHLAGVEGGAVFVTDTLGPVWVWSDNGLFLGHIYNDYYSGIQDDKNLYGEIQSTHVYTDTVTNKIMAVANDTGTHIHEVVLPGLTPVMGSTATLTPTQVAGIIPWDPDGPSPTEKPNYNIYTRKGATFPVTVDGNFDGREGWDYRDPTKGQLRSEAMILKDGSRLGGLRMMYDDQKLYLGYRVSAVNGALNSGSELPYSPFVSGAYVDFTVGPNWDGARKQVRDGDARVIIAKVKDGAGTADFQQGFWQKKAGGTNPQTITSPAASVHFDQIIAVPGLQMAYRIGNTNAGTGITDYDVEISVPLSSLGLLNPVGKTMGFDASVAIANAAGDRRERASHWAGLSEGVVVDRPGSTELLPDTWGTARFVPEDEETPEEPGQAGVTGLFNTGVDTNGTLLPGGNDDSHWKIVSTPSNGTYNAPAKVVNTGTWLTDAWTANGSNYKWLGLIPNEEAFTDPGGQYTYETTFNLLGSAAGFSLSGGYAIDDNLTEVKLNNTTVLTNPGGSYNALTNFTINNGFQTGTNTLQFILNNAGTSPSGLMVKFNPAAAPPPNVAPTVALTSPANSSMFTTASTVNLTATAADSDGTVSKVEFFAGTTLLGTDTSSPYAFSWSPTTAGSYSLTAKATDNAGAVTISSAVTITVNDVTQVTGLFNTGLNAAGSLLADGSNDPHWTIVSTPSNSSYNTPAKVVNGGTWLSDAWTSNGSDYKWLGLIASEVDFTDPAGEYAYQTTFNLNGNPAGFSLSGAYAADDNLVAIKLNGNTILSNPSGTYSSLTNFTLNSGFQTGSNTLQFVLNNAGTSPSGLLAKFNPAASGS